jgi:hypothetical protein
MKEHPVPLFIGTIAGIILLIYLTSGFDAKFTYDFFLGLAEYTLTAIVFLLLLISPFLFGLACSKIWKRVFDS